MKLSLKILALFVTALVAFPTLTADAAKPRRSQRTTTTTNRSHKRMDQFHQIVNKNKTNTSTSRPATTTRSTTTTSYSTSNSGRTDNSSRKAFLQNQIADWKQKLQKAEKSYQECLSSGEDTWEKQKVVESKKKTVDECLEMIRTYEAELNSLR